MDGKTALTKSCTNMVNNLSDLTKEFCIYLSSYLPDDTMGSLDTLDCTVWKCYGLSINYKLTLEYGCYTRTIYARTKYTTSDLSYTHEVTSVTDKYSASDLQTMLTNIRKNPEIYLGIGSLPSEFSTHLPRVIKTINKVPVNLDGVLVVHEGVYSRVGSNLDTRLDSYDDDEYPVRFDIYYTHPAGVHLDAIKINIDIRDNNPTELSIQLRNSTDLKTLLVG